MRMHVTPKPEGSLQVAAAAARMQSQQLQAKGIAELADRVYWSHFAHYDRMSSRPLWGRQ
ncbi:hypothetical protein Axy09_009 [Achromobacter phage vB_AxyP_19-32_Axy09]|uniref:Uncharacterized protein n=1 Tax=Achromobacter phage vB_AxyP_19-32_Axy09 TaxID=2591040 RepID=A0A514CTW7_9CAUD|nr:hypothetical protein Axy09_009 [Achromobacter phage vB_AxyP_19-32_Axy09]